MALTPSYSPRCLLANVIIAFSTAEAAAAAAPAKLQQFPDIIESHEQKLQKQNHQKSSLLVFGICRGVGFGM